MTEAEGRCMTEAESDEVLQLFADIERKLRVIENTLGSMLQITGRMEQRYLIWRAEHGDAEAVRLIEGRS
jgi:hypothetical protein